MKNVFEALYMDASNSKPSEPQSKDWFYAGYRDNYRHGKTDMYRIVPMNPKVIKTIHKQAPEGTMADTDEIDSWDDTYCGYCLMDTKKNVIGYVIVKKDIEWITSVEVFPQYRRRGYGHILVELGKKLGGKYLTCAKLNPVARELYEKHGFVLFEENKYGRLRMKLEGLPDRDPHGHY